MPLLRKLTWDDIKVTHAPDWVNRRGQERVHFSLRGFSSVCLTIWFKPWEDNPVNRAAVLLAMTRQARRMMKRLEPYLA